MTAGSPFAISRRYGLQVRLDVWPFAAIDGKGHVRIGRDRPVSGEMFRCRSHARLSHAEQVCDRELGDRGSIRVQRAVADRAADAVVDIDARRERHVDANRPQLGRHQPAQLPRERESFCMIQ